MAFYFTVLRKYAVFAGRARPKEYWMYVLISAVVVLVLGIVNGLWGADVPALPVYYSLAVVLPSLAVIEADTRHRIGYVGEWHSHPPNASVAMSQTDQATAVQLASDLTKDRLPAVCLISNGSDFDLTVIEDQK